MATPQPQTGELPVPAASKEELLAQLVAACAKGRDDDERKVLLLPAARRWLSDQVQRLRHQYESAGRPRLLLIQHARVMDILIGCLFQLACSKQRPSMVVLAVGGYGRKELFPYSDLDLLFLYEESAAQESRSISEFMLYVLWDLGLRVGQSHRMIDECLELSRSDLSIRTSLLDMRPIVGAKPLYETLNQRFYQEVVASDTLQFVEAKLSERDARHQRFGDSRYMLEPNVKEGKGGLRDLHTLWWLARYLYSVKRMRDLVNMKLLTEDEYQTFNQARQFLWRVRIHLHYQAGRAEDRLTFDRQHALAVSMGYAHPSSNRAIERFMRRYFVAVRTVGAMTRVFCALLEEEKNRKPRRPMAWLWHMPWTLGGFKLDGERLSVRAEQVLDANPVAMIEIFRVAQLHKLDIHPRALQWMARRLSHIDSRMQQDAHACQLFMEILLGDDSEITLRRMSDAGVLGRLIPDFGRVVGQTQFNMYHTYTVDEHTLVAIGILRNIEKGQVNAELPLATDIIHRIKMRRVLYLALFCHDIAKGRGGDHSELGERIAEKLALRFGFSLEEVETTAWLVRYHLLFSNTAFKRDIDDPKTIKDFVALVRTPERLKLLLILTAADIRAVGPAVWNAWKGALLRDLYKRAEQAMGTGEVQFKQNQANQLRDELKKRLPGWGESEIERYFELTSPTFWANFDITRHAVMARMLREAEVSDLPLLIDTHHTYEHSITEIIICTQDQPALFSKIAGALALSGANIISAKIFTLKSGLALDVFQVQDVSGQVFDRPDKLAKMSVFLEQALSGELDLSKAFMERRLAFGRGRDAIPTAAQVFIENDASNIYSVIELTGHDRPGILYEITHTMHMLGLSVAAAHISTFGTQVADVFYVKDAFGMKIVHQSRLRQVQETLLACMRAQPLQEAWGEGV